MKFYSVIKSAECSYILSGDNMNERKKVKEQKDKKDYYFSVVLSQLLCFSAVLLLFFTMNDTDKAAVREKYSSLLGEDFLSVEFASVVSEFKDYFIDQSKTFAVSGSRVEHYDNETTIPESDKAEDERTTFSEKEQTVSSDNEPAVQTALTVSSLNNSEKKVSTVPLKLVKEKPKKIIFPLDEGRYTSLFGERTDPITEGSDYHKGIDIGADEGDRIKAVYDGKVISVGEDERSGKYVFIEHKKGIVTFYCHCSEILVSKDDIVNQADTIALVGSTGYSTGPHLHFELRVNGESVDPLPLLENAD